MTTRDAPEAALAAVLHSEWASIACVGNGGDPHGWDACDIQAWWAWRAAAILVGIVGSHKPGDPHQYRITCEVCGERGTIRLTVDPETALAAEGGPA